MSNSAPQSIGAHAGELEGRIQALEAQLALLRDERDIRTTLERYGHSIDCDQQQQWLDCFTADAIYDYRPRIPQPNIAKMFPCGTLHPAGIRFEGRDALAALVAWWCEPAGKCRKHMIVDQLISQDGSADIARASSYFLILYDVAGSPEVVAFGRYLDRLIRSPDGRWRFIERIAEVESTKQLPMPPASRELRRQ